MSEIDALADQTPNLSPDKGHASPLQRSARMKNFKTATDRARMEHARLVAPGNRLRFSAHTPSLSTLKFMGDK